MHLTLRQLQIFIEAAREASFTAAARKLHLSQPAVSMQIRQLEDSLGLPLFEPSGRGIILSEAGETLLAYALQIEDLLQGAFQALDSMKGLERGRLRVTVASTANHFTSRLLADFSNHHPGIAISLDVTNRAALLHQLANNETDIVLMGEPPASMDLQAEPFMDNPLVAIAAPSHPLAQDKIIPLERLTQEKFIMRENGSGTREAIMRFFQQRGLEIKTALEMSSNEAIKQAVEAGMGLGIVSMHTLELELFAHRLVMLPVDQMPILRQWFMVLRKGKPQTPIIREFHDFVLSNSKRHTRLSIDSLVHRKIAAT